jgi:UDP-N-acetylmuramoylalanine--D-glutamate ligase
MSQVLIAGLGVTGEACARALSTLGYRVLVYEERDDLKHRELATELNTLGINVSFEIPEEIPPLVITSPGWKPDHPVIVAAQANGSQVMGEIEFSFNYYQQQRVAGKNQERVWIGVTGTNGKTSTVGMVESILKAAGKTAIACGNVGTPVIEVLTSKEYFEYLVVELSSFQLHWSTSLRLNAAALLNIDDDHLDWHGNFDNYLQAKLKIFHGAEQILINGDDPRLQGAIDSLEKRRELAKYTLQVPQYGELGVVEDLLVDRAFTGAENIATELAQLSDINPPVPHNVSNALAAAGLAMAVGIEPDAISKGLRNFTPGHHRIEMVLQKDGISWVNDSKATNPHAANAAFAAFDSVIWIAGGLAKGADIEKLVKRRHQQIRAAILIGTDRALIEKALLRHSPETAIILVNEDYSLESVERSKHLMREVILAAGRIAITGDTVLLAPACASMDQFQSYAERGELFAEAVKELVGEE